MNRFIHHNTAAAAGLLPAILDSLAFDIPRAKLHCIDTGRAGVEHQNHGAMWKSATWKNLEKAVNLVFVSSFESTCLSSVGFDQTRRIGLDPVKRNRMIQKLRKALAGNQRSVGDAGARYRAAAGCRHRPRARLMATGREGAVTAFAARIKATSILGLLTTVVLLFGFQGNVILENPFLIVLLRARS